MGTHGIKRRLGTRRYKKVTNEIKQGLESSKLEKVVSGAAKVAVVEAAHDAATLFLAAAEAYRLAKRDNWKADSDKVVAEAYRNAREIRKFRITKDGMADVKDALKRTLDEFARSRSVAS